MIHAYLSRFACHPGRIIRRYESDLCRIMRGMSVQFFLQKNGELFHRLVKDMEHNANLAYTESLHILKCFLYSLSTPHVPKYLVIIQFEKKEIIYAGREDIVIARTLPNISCPSVHIVSLLQSPFSCPALFFNLIICRKVTNAQPLSPQDLALNSGCGEGDRPLSAGELGLSNGLAATPNASKLSWLIASRES